MEYVLLVVAASIIVGTLVFVSRGHTRETSPLLVVYLPGEHEDGAAILVRSSTDVAAWPLPAGLPWSATVDRVAHIARMEGAIVAVDDIGTGASLTDSLRYEHGIFDVIPYRMHLTRLF